MIRQPFWNIAVLALLAFGAAPVHALPTYEYRFDQSNYTVPASGTLPVNVYLRENFTQGDTTLLDTEGLFGTGVRVEFNVPAVPSDPAEIAGPGDINVNALFDGFSFVDHVPGVSGGFIATVDLQSPFVIGSPGPSHFEILLGSFNFTAGSVPGQVTHIRALDFGPSDDNVTLPSLTVLDGLIAAANATISVDGAAVLPEPATWAAWMIAGAIGLAGSRRLWPRLMVR